MQPWQCSIIRANPLPCGPLTGMNPCTITQHMLAIPSPAWNNPVLPNNIIHYWSFDEDSGIEIINSIDPARNIDLSNWDATADLSDENRSVWGIKGKALRLKATDLNVTTVTGVIPAYPFTVATWHCLTQAS